MLFEIKLKYGKGECMAYFHDDKHSVFSYEQEYLLAGVGFEVRGVEKRVETYKGK